MKREVRAVLDVLDRYNAAIITEEGTTTAADAVHRALAALSLPSDKTVELLREARDYVEAEAEAATDDDCEGIARDLLARIDSHLGEMK